MGTCLEFHPSLVGMRGCPFTPGALGFGDVHFREQRTWLRGYLAFAFV